MPHYRNRRITHAVRRNDTISGIISSGVENVFSDFSSRGWLAVLAILVIISLLILDGIRRKVGQNCKFQLKT